MCVDLGAMLLRLFVGSSLVSDKCASSSFARMVRRASVEVERRRRLARIRLRLRHGMMPLSAEILDRLRRRRRARQLHRSRYKRCRWCKSVLRRSERIFTAYCRLYCQKAARERISQIMKLHIWNDIRAQR